MNTFSQTLTQTVKGASGEPVTSRVTVESSGNPDDAASVHRELSERVQEAVNVKGAVQVGEVRRADVPVTNCCRS